MRELTAAERIEIARARARRAREQLRAKHESMEAALEAEVLERELRCEPAPNAPKETTRRPRRALDTRPQTGEARDDVVEAAARKLAREFGLPVPRKAG